MATLDHKRGIRGPNTARSPLSAIARALVHDTNGNVAILFGLLSVPLMMFTGAAIDYGFATRLETKLQAATDATALLLCQMDPSTSTATLYTTAQTVMTGQMGAAGLVVDQPVVTSNPRQITLTAHKIQTAFLGKLTGVASFNPGAKATCATAGSQLFEIALVLDNSGSMSESASGQTKMQAVQTAASNVVDLVLGSNSSFAKGTRMSIVPFGAAVAVDPKNYRTASWIDQNGKASYHWNNVASPNSVGFTSRLSIFTALQKVNSGWDWTGCLESLPYPLNVRDGAPSSTNADSYYVPMFAPDEPGEGSRYKKDYQVGNTTYTSYNSYIDDYSSTSSSSSCGPLASGTSFATAEARVCKYVNARDASPTTKSDLGIPNGPNFLCTTQPLQRLTDSASTLKTLINQMAPLGSTNIHEGFMWGWRTLSPKSVFADGTAYTTASTPAASAVNKVIILMTDGINSWADNPNTNYNNSYYSSYGYFTNADGTKPNSRTPTNYQNVSSGAAGRSAMDALTAEACTNAKSANISVYTIGFSVPSNQIDSAGQTLLKNCANNNQFYIANNADDVIAAFKKIVVGLGALRLVQ